MKRNPELLASILRAMEGGIPYKCTNNELRYHLLLAADYGLVDYKLPPKGKEALDILHEFDKIQIMGELIQQGGGKMDTRDPTDTLWYKCVRAFQWVIT